MLRAAVFSLAALSLSIAGCTTPQPGCTDDGDCLNGFACRAGACVPEEDVGPADTGTGTDAGMDAPTDVPRDVAADAGPPPVLRANGMPPDLTCRGTRTLPPGVVAATSTVEITDLFGASLDVPTLALVPGWLDAASCTGACRVAPSTPRTLPSGAVLSGHASLDPPFHLRWYGVTWAAAMDRVPLIATDAAGLASLSETLGVDTTYGAIALLTDCAGQPLENARIEVWAMDSEVTSAVTIGYEDGGVFVLDRSGTAASGALAALAPMLMAGGGAGLVRVEVWGRLDETSADERIGCEEVTIEDPGLTVAVIGPLRADYPSDSACP